MSIISIIKAPVTNDLETFNSEFSKLLKTNVPLLNVITRYLLRKKSKQIRPLLVFLSAKMVSDISKSTYIAASLIELLHTATLIHDDVFDESYEKHGGFSINSLWKSKISVLLGDFLLAKALLIAVGNKEYDILGIVSDAVREMSEGELLQIQKLRKLNPTEQDYFEIIHKKTATLISACTASGVRSVTNNPHLIEKMKSFGINIGIAFQIKDDLFDYEYDSLIRKLKVNNIHHKRLTLPLLAAISNAPSIKKSEILNLINKKTLGGKNSKIVFDFVHEYNGIKYSKQKMLQYRDEALKILMHFENNESRKCIELLVNYFIERKN
jgi:octaprenyl-diphosphate synthase